MSIQSSINQAVNGMMSMIMPMSLLKEQGKAKQIKAEQEALKKSNEELTKRNEREMKIWDEILENSPGVTDPAADFLTYGDIFSAGNGMASNVAQQRVDAARENKRKNQFENLQKAFNNIGMGGNV